MDLIKEIFKSILMSICCIGDYLSAGYNFF